MRSGLEQAIPFKAARRGDLQPVLAWCAAPAASVALPFPGWAR